MNILLDLQRIHLQALADNTLDRLVLVVDLLVYNSIVWQIGVDVSRRNVAESLNVSATFGEIEHAHVSKVVKFQRFKQRLWLEALRRSVVDDHLYVLRDHVAILRRQIQTLMDQIATYWNNFVHHEVEKFVFAHLFFQAVKTS